MINPIGPDIPAALRPILTQMRDALIELQTPTSPQLMFACPQASLPPAANYTYRYAMVIDLGIPAISDGTDWLRFDTGAPI